MTAPVLQTARLTLRPLAADDWTACAAFLASDRAAYITGEAVNITGGLWMN